MNKKTLVSILLGIIAASSSASANYSNSKSVSPGTRALGFVLSNGNYYTESQSSTQVSSQTYANASLTAYLGGNAKSVFTITPWNQGITSWNKGANVGYSELLKNESTFLGISMAAPTWTSCGTLCASSTKTLEYDKSVISASYDFVIYYIPISMSASLKVSTGVSAYTRGDNSPRTDKRTYQYASASITPYAKLYTYASEGIGFASLGAGLYQNFTLFEGSLPNQAYTYVSVPLASSTASRYSRSSETVNITFGSGEIGFYYKYILGEGNKPIYSWNGLTAQVGEIWDTKVVPSTTVMW